MNKKTKTEQLERLFEEWQQEQINEPKETLDKTMLKDAKIVRFNSFCKDGIICEEQFEKEKIKVLFIGNEPNIDNKKDIEDWKKGKEFPLVTSQISDFNNYFDEHHDDWTGKLRQRICEVIYPAMLEPHKNAFPVENGWVNAKKIAFMNLNKRGGKGNIEDHLKNYCNEYKEYIKKEISIINPDIIIWLGKSSFDMCNNTLFDNNCGQIDNCCFLVKIKDYTIPLILTHHTSSRISSQKRGDIVRVAYDNYKKSIRK